MIAVAIVLATALLYATVQKPEEVRTARVVQGPLQLCVDEDAITRVRELYDVSAPTSARLERVEVRAGDVVNAGAPLVVLAPLPRDASTESQLRARAQAAASERREADSRALSARATHDVAERELSRASRATRAGEMSAEDLDRARSAEKIARRELDAARERAAIAEWDSEVTTSALEAARHLRGIVLRAPIGGKVLRVLHQGGAIVDTDTRILEVGDPNDVEVVIDLLTTDAVRVLPGARVLVKDWGGEAPLEAHVRRIEPGGFTKVSARGVEEQRVNVLADLDAPEPGLGDHFRVTACVVLWQGTALRIPNVALFTTQAGPATYVARNGRLELRALRIGQSGTDDSQVLDGLAEGDEVVLHPSDRIHDGSRVRTRQ